MLVSVRFFGFVYDKVRRISLEYCLYCDYNLYICNYQLKH